MTISTIVSQNAPCDMVYKEEAKKLSTIKSPTIYPNKCSLGKINPPIKFSMMIIKSKIQIGNGVAIVDGRVFCNMVITSLKKKIIIARNGAINPATSPSIKLLRLIINPHKAVLISVGIRAVTFSITKNLLRNYPEKPNLATKHI